MADIGPTPPFVLEFHAEAPRPMLTVSLDGVVTFDWDAIRDKAASSVPEGKDEWWGVARGLLAARGSCQPK